MGSLIVNLAYHGQWSGRLLFQDAALRVLNAADAIGVRGLLVHALPDAAKAFHLCRSLLAWLRGAS